MISIAIDNARDNTVGGGCNSAHQAVSKFAEHNIDMVLSSSQMPDSTLECVTKTDSKFSNRVLV